MKKLKVISELLHHDNKKLYLCCRMATHQDKNTIRRGKVVSAADYYAARPMEA